MKITVTINTGSTLVTVDFYPQDNILWIKTNGVCVQKHLTTDEATLATQLLASNPVGKFLEMVTEKVDGFKKIHASEVASELKHPEDGTRYCPLRKPAYYTEVQFPKLAGLY